ncbi:DUF5815 family protein [Halapricum desulfuricans]|uniref:Uncharacterized protein n=1 Tax=Halapricum desulfuricans TaxID=2841257 RepID=A0A897MX12_9EURY|nr:DUF5815 family protein [Halapricum desulfuricans]QSG05004.1 Uncharacterized protein HSR121_0649 [Halapricum desulfuricans]
MPEPRVPGSGGDRMELPCGETVSPRAFDLGQREFDCDCGETHAIVTDAHPLSRFVPEDIAAQLRAVIDTDDEYEEFSTVHLMGSVLEEFPEEIVVEDVSEDGQIGAALIWVADFDSRRLHRVVVELLVELMDHAVGHTDDDELQAEFESQMAEFDVEGFIEAYRDQRDFEDEYDRPV